MIILNNDVPTSTALSVKIGDKVSDGKNLTGIVSNIQIEETDASLLLIFKLNSGEEIIVKKMRQVC
ncbi:hypothetical protein [Pedobacter sandarakinus]|uniref:hypothetical protein n=1 Tax=Pedobacter sandarakinus TaxID=353156 RepID=UPI0022484434|nr:hypothetical protein [Pedobacter sandarakinus]MCX2574527.1 hypothetical protein [Pedobacter sandarakinus]